jgi:phosphoglycolate phosphatase
MRFSISAMRRFRRGSGAVHRTAARSDLSIETDGISADARRRARCQVSRSATPKWASPRTCIYPGIAEALYALDAAGVPLGLCTSKRADFAESILELFGLRDHFRFVSGGDIGIRKSDQLATLLRRA